MGVSMWDASEWPEEKSDVASWAAEGSHDSNPTEMDTT